MAVPPTLSHINVPSTPAVAPPPVCAGYPPPPRGSRPFEEVLIAPRPTLLAAAAPLAVAPVAPVVPAVAGAAPKPYPLSQSRFPTESTYVQAYHQTQQQPSQPLQMVQPRLLADAQLQSESQAPSPPQSQPSSAAQPKQAQAASRTRQITLRRAQKLQQRRNAPPYIPIAAIAAASGYTIIYHPSINLPFTQQEGLYFQLFRMQTASELSGFFDDVFWSRLVLVECHSEAAIRHAVVALGALYKTLEATTESPPTSPADTDVDRNDNARVHWQVALRQYSDACHELRIIDNDDERAQRTRLMASVLLACFDSFIGHHRHAIIQIQTGLGLLHRLRVERRTSLTDAGTASSTASEPVENELTQMFTRLAIQAKSYDMAFHFPQPYVVQLLSPGSTTSNTLRNTSDTTSGNTMTPSPATPGNTETSAAGASASSDTAPSPPSTGSPTASSNANTAEAALPTSTHQKAIPDQFASLREARQSWDMLLEHIFRYMEMMLQYAKGPPNLLPASMKSHGALFMMYMESWSNAFEPLLISRSHPGVSSQEKAAIAVLKMFQVMGVILYVMTFSDSEMMFDAYQQQFQKIVDLASEVVGDEERRAASNRCPDPTRCVHHYHTTHPQDPNSAGPGSSGDYDACHGFYFHTSHIKASFSADLGIVPPLYVVATKSRDRVLRRQAIQLLRSSARREGMWDSELAARIAMWVVNIEEEGEEAEFYEALQRYDHHDANLGMGVEIGMGLDLGFGMDPGPGPGLGPDTSSAMRSGSTGRGSPMSPASFLPQPPPLQSQNSQQTSTSRSSSVEFGSVPLGPGGNARWDMRRASQASVLHTKSGMSSSIPITSPQDLTSLPPSTPLAPPQQLSPPLPVSAFSHITAPLDPNIPYYMQTQHPIPAEKRILVKTCEFDLRERTATLTCGTRGLAAGVLDTKTRQTEFKW
ncbi:hypothetical protein SPBR_06521 [Sporothrix brasiliensis 5110]|uniref:C6 zinc finger domain containing protein n=1 Tax=Sporothrix brasiliensis 5110 TaxID=1398154 RepID=A0A0C2IGR7_9PEZI|nr:uncharacterized protein SPBR_06521 [Sporothrix brasiliensis 5110]KIH88406.1 hypothetical protein SPBR_06521 [Sporothrix brasiliensis 5110]